MDTNNETADSHKEPRKSRRGFIANNFDTLTSTSAIPATRDNGGGAIGYCRAQSGAVSRLASAPHRRSADEPHSGPTDDWKQRSKLRAVDARQVEETFAAKLAAILTAVSRSKPPTWRALIRAPPKQQGDGVAVAHLAKSINLFRSRWCAAAATCSPMGGRRD